MNENFTVGLIYPYTCFICETTWWVFLKFDIEGLHWYLFVEIHSGLLNIDLAYKKIGSDCIDFSKGQVIVQNYTRDTKFSFYEDYSFYLRHFYMADI
jgi:hypothetical protein